MNLPGIFLSIAIGGAAAAAGYFLFRFFFRNDEDSRGKYGLTAAVIVFAAVSYLSYIVVSPLIIRMGIERIVSDAMDKNAYVAFIRKNDRSAYMSIMNELTEKFQKTKNPSEAGKAVLETALKYMGHYLVSCDDAVMMKLGVVKMDMLKETFRQDPLYVLMSEYPKIYGTPTNWTGLLSPELTKRYQATLLEVIASGISNKNAFFDQSGAQLAFQRKVSEFARDNPGQYSILANREPRKTAPSRKALADSTIRFYEYILIRNTNDTPKILKLNLSGML